MTEKLTRDRHAESFLAARDKPHSVDNANLILELVPTCEETGFPCIPLLLILPKADKTVFGQEGGESTFAFSWPYPKGLRGVGLLSADLVVYKGYPFGYETLAHYQSDINLFGDTMTYRDTLVFYWNAFTFAPLRGK